MRTWLLGISVVSLITWSGSTYTVLAAEQAPAKSVSTLVPKATGQGLDADPSRPAHRLEINSSVQVSREALRAAFMASREAYTKKLQKYAKCSPSEAKKVIASAHPNMKIDNLELRNIRTNLVYMATVENDDNRFLVVVDAGNAKVLLDRPLPTHHERVFAGG